LFKLAFQHSQLATSTRSDDEKRKDAVVIAQNVLNAPRGSMPDWMHRTINFIQFISLKLFSDWKVFDLIPMDDSVSYEHLAGHLLADVSLISCLSWVLISGGILNQVGEDRVAHTERSKSYLSDTPNELLLGMMQVLYEEQILTSLKLPEYFAQYGRREPATRTHTPYAFARGKPESEVWELHEENPEHVKKFMKRMDISQQVISLVGIYDLSWVEAKLSVDHDRPIFVDVGGSKGHAIKEILEDNPILPVDRMILQDRAEVIEQLSALKQPSLERFKLQAHDFHNEQPAKNALIYWIRRCLHNFGDDDSVKILSQLSDAMGSDSKLLVIEYVLRSPPSLMGVMADFGMMEIGGKERTTGNWEALVARAGLKIEKIYGMNMKIQVIECVKV
ncbi:O-methyltransferase, partial [Colletotrichum somersetense]